MTVLKDHEKASLLHYLRGTVLDVIENCGEEGAPAGALYNALMHLGLSWDNFCILMGLVEATGEVVKNNHRYWAKSVDTYGLMGGR